MQEIERLYKILRQRRQEIGEAMVYGNVKDMEHYRQLVGNIESLLFREEELKRILEKAEAEF